MARISQDDLTKAALAEKFTLQLVKKDTKIKELEKEIANLKNEIKQKEKDLTIYTTDENKTKRILDLFAQGHQYSVILEKMKFTSFDIDIEEIRDICLNIDSLTPEQQCYYKSQVESFEKSIKINPELLKDVLTKRYNFLYNEASMDLIKSVEIEERRRIRNEMKDHMKELNNVLKNIVENDKEIKTNETLSKIANGLSKTLSSDYDDYEEFSMEDIEVM